MKKIVFVVALLLCLTIPMGGFAEENEMCATFNDASLTLEVPCFIYGETYSLKLKMSDVVNLQFQLTEMNPTGGTDTNAETKLLKFIETTDVHASLFPYDFITAEETTSSLAQVSTYVKEQRAMENQSVILLDNGDILQGQPIANFFNYERSTLDNHIIAEVMNYMEYNAATVGNHDIEPGKAVYDAINEQFDFPWLAANCINTLTGEPYFKPYTIITVDGIKVAVLGLITPGIPKWLPPSVWPNMEFRDMIDTAANWVPYIQQTEDPDIFVGLFHSGTDYTYGGTDADTPTNENASKLVAQKVPGFDVIFVGHDHMEQTETVTVEGTDDLVYIIGAKNGAQSIGEATLSLVKKDGKWEIASIDTATIDATQFDVDLELYNSFSAQIQATKDYVNEEIGTFTDSTTSRESMFGDSSFNDLVHDLQFKVARNVIGIEPDISFAAPLQFDSTIEAGTVYVRDMYKLYKYENTLYVMELTGNEVDGHLEYSYAMWANQMSAATDHLINFKSYDEATGNYDLAARYYNYDSAAGIVYTVDVTKPAYDRVDILGMDRNLDGVVDAGSSFDPTATYKVAINSYRAGGGGGHLTNGAGIDSSELVNRQIGVTARDLRYYLIEEIQNQQQVTPKTIGNWRFIPEDWATAGAAMDYDILYATGDGVH
ncbi:2',3'-cyclic-nucleotide 2'-phosphodiesterase [Desulfamplus magnetovallimortis]|uniref:2',3'-cyclic-nucleotide 2'-phosphodiesterase n=1 Tax=Desulfamplus magnetovallimortis TaxID=1246637 RepID=A0A1W1HKB2_9BACT|nr:5'-nucleotidase C-terminal domain-containing protein [Desulfamplus magnetovallimortis]SLM32909.1 2',3'-cyclic-nucleotide 2'-phosphodiesterase [Desulfamplus magnetovallimortis]